MKKKIAVIGLKGIPAFGGAATVGENLVNELKEYYDFTVLSISSHASKDDIEVNGVKQKVFKSIGKKGINTLTYYIKSLLYVLFNKFDIIHLHHSSVGFITPILRLKYKVIVTFHGVFDDQDPKFSRIQNKFIRFSQKMNINFANEIISVSKPDQIFILEKYKREIKYIPNGINVDTNSINIKNKDNFQLSFAAGRIYQIKGLHLVLKALNEINHSIPLVVAGDIDQVQEYKNEISKLSTNLNVNYLGLLKDKKKLFEIIQNSTCFVFPSLTEAMSMMLLEAASLKTPIIASDIPANKAIFSDSEVLFFKSEDYQDLKLKIKYAIDNPEKMKQKAESAYNKLLRDYNWGSIAQEYRIIIESLLN